MHRCDNRLQSIVMQKRYLHSHLAICNYFCLCLCVNSSRSHDRECVELARVQRAAELDANVTSITHSKQTIARYILYRYNAINAITHLHAIITQVCRLETATQLSPTSFACNNRPAIARFGAARANTSNCTAPRKHAHTHTQEQKLGLCDVEWSGAE